MSSDTSAAKELIDFVDGWSQDPNNTKNCFLEFKDYLASLDNVTFNFVPRPGITYSLRCKHAAQQSRDLFVMVDVIDDDPTDRWLSVVFYNEMVNDPDEAGDEVPEGLMGEDARCFDLYEGDDAATEYIKTRMTEAAESAARG